MNSAGFASAVLSVGAAAVWGAGDFAGGLASKSANVFRVVAGAHACGLLLMLALAWATGEPIPPRSSLAWGVVAGITGAFGIAALYRALAIGRMGIVAPVASVVTGILPVLFGIRSEGLPDRLQLAGFVLALVSIWLVARPDGEIDSHRGLGLAVLAGVMFGLFSSLADRRGIMGSSGR
jgi:drug/metabolite transporter (DMT)-like permease